MSYRMWVELASHIREMGANEAVKVLLLEGQGEQAFVSGADISEFEAMRDCGDKAEVYDAAVDTAISQVLKFPKPVISKIRGICFGGGLALALASDIRIADTRSTFALPAARLGIGYRFNWLRRMVNLLGETVAADLIFTGRAIDAAEALHLRLVNRVIDGQVINKEVEGYCAIITSNAPLSIAAAKSGINMLRDGTPSEDANNAIRALIHRCAASNDYKEGIRAFKERRSPIFHGR